MAAIYKDTRNGEIATFISKNSKFKTVLLQPIYPEDASPISITTSTLKKYWVEITEDDISVNDSDDTGEIRIDITTSDEIVVDNDKEEVETIVEDDDITAVIRRVADKHSIELKRNTRAFYNSDFFIVPHKYGVRIYLRPVSYEKLKWFKVPVAKVTDTENKTLPTSVKITKENVTNALEVIFKAD